MQSPQTEIPHSAHSAKTLKYFWKLDCNQELQQKNTKYGLADESQVQTLRVKLLQIRVQSVDFG